MIVEVGNASWKPSEDGVDECPRKLYGLPRFLQGRLPGRARISEPRCILSQRRDLFDCWGERAIHPYAQFAQLLQIVGPPKG